MKDGRRHREIKEARKEVAVGLVGHPTNVVSDVAPQRVLATIGEDLRDQEAKELANAVDHGVRLSPGGLLGLREFRSGEQTPLACRSS